MIRDDHEVAAREGGIDSPGRIGQNEGFGAESADYARAEGDLVHRVAFVVVDAAFEDDNADIEGPYS